LKEFNSLSLLFVSGWISVSASESHTVEVQSGGDVTLMCSNMLSVSSVAFWFRLVNTSNVSCVSVMYNADTAEYCNGFQNGRFNMSTNISTLFLQIKQVNVSDSGLYFCGFYTSGNLLFSVTYLNVEGKFIRKSFASILLLTLQNKLTIVILGAVMVFLLNVIIVLVVKIRKLQRGTFSELYIYIHCIIMLKKYRGQRMYLSLSHS
uniref:Ig-like domain-containing protein n=1 Tax=Sander lucioperca TaxID=283035 RepID=A0A8C9X723_SANLU